MKSTSSTPKRPRPTPEQPGTLRDQMAIVTLYLANPWRFSDLDRRWQASRRTVLQHARRGR